MKRPSLSGIYVLVVIGILSAAEGRLTLGLPDPDSSIHAHHLQHIFFVLAGAVWGIALARALLRLRGGAAGEEQGSGLWLFAAILAPAAIMFEMWPTTYPYLEAHPFVHFLEHALLVVLGFATTFSGYRFSRGIGWALGGVAIAMAWAAAYGYGVIPGPNPLLTTAAAAQGQPPVAAAAPPGKSVYDQHCAACHQARGTGVPGAFPPLADHVPLLLAVPNGRNYVEHVVLDGLQGTLTVQGNTYNGVMPPWGPQLSDQQIADALDYIATAWGNVRPAGQGPFTATELAQARSERLTPQQGYQLRQKLNLP